MRLLLDTHVLLWWHDQPERFTDTAHDAISNLDNDVFVSVVNGWEIQIKSQLGKLNKQNSDSGNAAFRAGDHQAALDHFTRAKDLKDDVAAAWFGIYMSQHALGNEEAAQEAFAKAQKISPGATLIHPTGTDTSR